MLSQSQARPLFSLLLLPAFLAIASLLVPAKGPGSS